MISSSASGIAEFYDLDRMAAESLSDAGIRPSERDTGLQCHQPMGDFAEDGSREEPVNFLPSYPLGQVLATGSQGRIGGKGVNKDIGVDKNGFARGNIQERHGYSSTLSSGSSAILRRVSGSPFQAIRP